MGCGWVGCAEGRVGRVGLGLGDGCRLRAGCWCRVGLGQGAAGWVPVRDGCWVLGAGCRESPDAGQVGCGLLREASAGELYGPEQTGCRHPYVKGVIFYFYTALWFPFLHSSNCSLPQISPRCGLSFSGSAPLSEGIQTPRCADPAPTRPPAKSSSGCGGGLTARPGQAAQSPQHLAAPDLAAGTEGQSPEDPSSCGPAWRRGRAPRGRVAMLARLRPLPWPPGSRCLSLPWLWERMQSFYQTKYFFC